MNSQSQAHSFGALESRARARIQEALDTLVPEGQTFSIATWTQRLESFLYIKIPFFALPLPAGFFGARAVLLPNSRVQNSRPIEIVITAAGLLPIMAEHVRAHELAHITLGHQTVILTSQQFIDLQGDISTICQCPGATCRAVDPARDALPHVQRDVMAETLARLAEKRHMELQIRGRAEGISSDAAIDRLVKSIIGA